MEMKQIAILMVLSAAMCGCVSHRPLTVDDSNALVSLARQLDSQVSSGMSLCELEKLFGAKAKMRVWAQTSGYFQFAVRPTLGALAYCQATNNGYVLHKRHVEFHVNLPAWDSTPIRARLSESNVIAIADALAIETKRQFEGFDLKQYPERFPQIDLEGKEWSIVYWRVPNRWPGDHFSITVNDATGEAKYFGGL